MTCVSVWIDESRCCPCGDESHPPPSVLDAVWDAFPKDFEEILKGMRYHGGPFDRYWSFDRWGMFVGVEEDGYIHS